MNTPWLCSQLPGSQPHLCHWAEHVCAACSLSAQALPSSPPEAEEEEVAVIVTWFKGRWGAACGAECPSLARAHLLNTFHLQRDERFISAYVSEWHHLFCKQESKHRSWLFSFSKIGMWTCFLGSPSPAGRAKNTLKANGGQCCKPLSDVKDPSFNVSLKKKEIVTTCHSIITGFKSYVF